MDSKALNSASGVDGALPPRRPPQPDAPTQAVHAAQQQAADLRLVIEKDNGTGSYVYKTVDRRTGEIVQQLPRDELLRRHAEGEYAAGEVVRAKA